MKVKETIKEVLPIKDFDNYYVLADFDKTITSGASMTSWSVLANSDLVPGSYVNDRQTLYDQYRPIELDESMEFTERSNKVREWFKLHAELFVKYRISEEIFKEAARDLRKMEFRPYAKNFLKFLNDKHIPLIIISAGIGNFIEEFLRNNDCYYDNIYVSSNKIIFKNGVAWGVDGNIIHSLNKNEVSLPTEIKAKLKDRDKVVLLGDQITDIKMVDETKHSEIIKVGFLTEETANMRIDYEKNFDIVIDKQNDYSDILREVFKEEV